MKPPRQPKRLEELYKQIWEHPKYSELSEGTRFGFEAAARGWSWKTKENNQYCRRLWNHLYLGTDWE